jgi:DnaJ-class molecular chaperone
MDHCPDCKGKGKIMEYIRNLSGQFQGSVKHVCCGCGGSGYAGYRFETVRSDVDHSLSPGSTVYSYKETKTGWKKTVEVVKDGSGSEGDKDTEQKDGEV